MAELNNPMEILKILNKSNCGECGEATCLAFAGAVFKGRKTLETCPHLDSGILDQFQKVPEPEKPVDQDLNESLKKMKQKLAQTDLAASAERLGGRFSGGRLILKILGKDFGMDPEGNFSSDIHIHSWLTGPFLNYVLKGAGKPVSGQWIPFRELNHGKEWAGLYGQRCEKPLKKVADTYTDLFNDMIHIFNGKKVENHYESDISLVLHPLPKFPILVCYWVPEDGLDSSLTLFFDKTANENLNTEAIYSLCAGLALMFEKMALTHGTLR